MQNDDEGPRQYKNTQPEPTHDPETVTVKWFDGDKKNFGFVQPENNGKDLFLHISVLKLAGVEAAQLKEGTKLLIQRGPGRQGPGSEAVVKLIRIL